MNQIVAPPWWAKMPQKAPIIIGDPANDLLDAFITWFFNNIEPIGRVPLLDAVRYIEKVTAVLWFREGPFQVQMFIVPPKHIIPEHIHPNVDSYEVYVGGQIDFSKNKEWVAPKEDFAASDERGLPKMRGRCIRVKPHEWHGGVAGPHGAVFLSIQRWLNGVKPHCVACDYTGPVMGEDHLDQVKFGEPVLRQILSELDAVDSTLSEHR